MRRVAVLLIVLTSVLTASQAQCPMCKTALQSNKGKGEKAAVGNGINKGILFLMAMPYLLVGAAGFAWYRNQKKKNA